MVDRSSLPKNAVEDLMNWYSQLPAGIAELEQEETDDEYVISFLPTNPAASSLEFRFGNNMPDSFGLYFGVGFNIEEVPFDETLVLDIAESIRAGNLEEYVWTWGDLELKTQGVLHLKSHDPLFDTGYYFCLPIWRFVEKRQKKYQPWDSR